MDEFLKDLNVNEEALQKAQKDAKEAGQNVLETGANLKDTAVDILQAFADRFLGKAERMADKFRTSEHPEQVCGEILGKAVDKCKDQMQKAYEYGYMAGEQLKQCNSNLDLTNAFKNIDDGSIKINSLDTLGSKISGMLKDAGRGALDNSAFSKLPEYTSRLSNVLQKMKVPENSLTHYIEHVKDAIAMKTDKAEYRDSDGKTHGFGMEKEFRDGKGKTLNPLPSEKKNKNLSNDDLVR